MQKKSACLLISIILVASLLIGPLACSSQNTSLPVVLLSDFGDGDYRISQLKGFIVSQNYEANLIDASHSVPSFDVPAGAFLLYLAAREFPSRIVFVGVVNTYVASRYLVLTNNRDQIFVVPDNGLISYVIKEMGARSLYQIDNQSLFDAAAAGLSSEYLEGTIGGKISAGLDPKDVGTAVSDQKMLDIQDPAMVDNKLLGTVVYVDSFGNCVTNISESTAAQYGLLPGSSLLISGGSSPVFAQYGQIYSDVPQGKEIVFVNSNLGLVQLSINLGNYSETYKVKAGDKIAVQKTGN